MDKIKKIPACGDIFMIPLYLPSYQKWRDPLFDEFIDYKRYRFHRGDPFAFGRIIEPYAKNLYIMVILRYTRSIPESPECIIQSGLLLKPLIAGGMFHRGRWRVVFEHPAYDKWKDSDYDTISFLYGTSVWKGGKDIPITPQQHHELWHSGDIALPAINGPVAVECNIRQILAEQGVELDYEQTVAGRRDEYPRPRDMDKTLKETILPFRWIGENRSYTLTLDANALNLEIFAEAGLSGSGYDWEQIAITYIEENMAELQSKFTFDCEADTFSVRTSVKKVLKEFAIAFHQCCMDPAAFRALLTKSREADSYLS